MSPSVVSGAATLALHELSVPDADSGHLTARDLPLPHDPFTVDHLACWPMGTGRAELDDGELVWVGDFDERDADMLAAWRYLPSWRPYRQAAMPSPTGPGRESRHGRVRPNTSRRSLPWCASSACPTSISAASQPPSASAPFVSRVSATRE